MLSFYKKGNKTSCVLLKKWKILNDKLLQSWLQNENVSWGD